MKIRESLRVYIASVGISLGLLVAIGSGIYSSYNLYVGVDLVTRSLMLIKAETEDPVKGHPVIVPPFTIAADWHDLPRSFQRIYSRDELVANQLVKRVETVDADRGREYTYFLLKCQTDKGNKYVALKLNEAAFDEYTDSIDINVMPHQGDIAAFVVCVLFLCLIAVYRIVKKITTPVEELKEWAVNLREKNDFSQVPDFKFSELNVTARVISSSLNTVKKTLDSEKDFIRYASHELRTPIAVMRSSSELLEKMIISDRPKERILKNLRHIHNNSVAMSNLCESLLWLQRDHNLEHQRESVFLGTLVEQVINEQRYLLDGKQVTVEVCVDDSESTHFSEMCKIVITNLVRNAFQHTSNGQVKVIQTGSCIEVSNFEHLDDFQSDSSGFGLGVMLVKKICTKYHWKYQETIEAKGREVTVTFG